MLLLLGLVGGPIRQLTVSLGKVVILVQDDSSVALIGRENKDVGVGAERAESRFFGFGEVGSLWEGGRKFGIRDVSSPPIRATLLSSWTRMTTLSGRPSVV